MKIPCSLKSGAHRHHQSLSFLSEHTFSCCLSVGVSDFSCVFSNALKNKEEPYSSAAQGHHRRMIHMMGLVQVLRQMPFLVQLGFKPVVPLCYQGDKLQ